MTVGPPLHPPRRTTLRRGMVVTTVLALVALVHACATPTQVTVLITTNFPCKQLSGVTITVGPSPQAVEGKVASRFVTTKTQACDSDHVVGSLVVTPGERSAAIVVAAALAGDPTECVPPLYAGCIVARRSFSFVEHVALRIPIELEEQCKDLPCDAITTCTKGACIPSNAGCQNDGTCAMPDGGTVGPGQDAGNDASKDAMVMSDAANAVDAPGDTAKPDTGAPGGTNTCGAADKAFGNMCGDGGDCSATLGFCCTDENGARQCTSPGKPCATLAMCCLGDTDCPAGKQCCIGDLTASRTSATCGSCDKAHQVWGAGPGTTCDEGQPTTKWPKVINCL